MRREQLVAAAAKLFEEGGTKAVTHRSVSEAAQVPLATVSYYFASIDQLVDVMFGEALTHWTDEWAALVPEAGTSLSAEEAADRFIAPMRTLSPDRPSHYLNVYLAALARPHLLEAVHAMRDACFGNQVAILAATGVPDPVEVTRGASLLYSGALVAAADREIGLDGVLLLLQSHVVELVRRALPQQA
ncbi:MAG: TetR family transcriptional regulator [Propionibacteriales bacterium]|nr:TetR family transcriptional regulator [Propionibacteriales bacterium]